MCLVCARTHRRDCWPDDSSLLLTLTFVAFQGFVWKSSSLVASPLLKSNNTRPCPSSQVQELVLRSCAGERR